MPQLLMRSLALEGIRQISLADFGKCIRSNLILWKFHSCVTIWGFLLVAHFFQKMLWNPLLICCHFQPTCEYIWVIAELLFPPFCWWDSIRTLSIYVNKFYVSKTGKKRCCLHGSSVGCVDNSKVLEFTNVLYVTKLFQVALTTSRVTEFKFSLEVHTLICCAQSCCNLL